jgi:hypothetical protein
MKVKNKKTDKIILSVSSLNTNTIKKKALHKTTNNIENPKRFIGSRQFLPFYDKIYLRITYGILCIQRNLSYTLN